MAATTTGLPATGQAFALAIGGMGVVFLLWPEGAPWLGLALVLGSLYALEAKAASAGVPGPLQDLGLAAAQGQPAPPAGG